MKETLSDPNDFVRRHFGPEASIELLAGDASARTYYRLSTRDAGTRVLLFETRAFDAGSDFFLLTASFFERARLPVPAVLSSFPEEGVVLLEDLGSTSLQTFLESAPAEARRKHYDDAIDLILRLQHEGAAALGPEAPAYHLCLDGTRFRRELNYFLEHYVDGILENPLADNPARRASLEDCLTRLADQAGRPGDRTLCHRDFHSRNLMLLERSAGTSPSLVMIDFQDARLGPRTYDLASLLEDAYVEISDELAAGLKERFLAGLPRRLDREAFEQDYAVVAAQRTLKAVGTFAGQSTLFGNQAYLDSIPRALACARRALKHLPEYKPVLDLLEGSLAYPPQ